MKPKNFIFAIVVTVIATLLSWTFMLASSSNSGGHGGSSWSSGSGSYSGSSGGGHK